MRLTIGLVALAALAGWIVVAASAASAAGYHPEYHFRGRHDGSGPQSSLIKVGGKLYGTTSSGGVHGVGTIYAFDPSTGAETPLYAFEGGADGASPFGDLIKVGGKLYGATRFGGGGGSGICSTGCGTVFSFDPGTGAEAVVHAFQGRPDGESPSALLNVGGVLYGTTEGPPVGAVFSIDLATGLESTLHVFRGGTDGLDPAGGLIDVGGVLYGATQYGGSTNCGGPGCGVVFAFDPATGHEQVVYAFKGGADGALPAYARLLEVGGLLYGTTDEGGGGGTLGNGSGTVFSVDPASGAETLLHAFQGGGDGAAPGAGALTAVGDTLYGVTFRGGGSTYEACGTIGCGTVFSLNLTTGVEQVLYAFKGKQAGFPYAGLTYVGQRLFGTTVYGGRISDCDYLGCGALFSIRP